MISPNTYAYLRSHFSRDDGQTMAEYGVTLGVITFGAVGAFLFLSGKIEDVITVVASLI